MSEDELWERVETAIGEIVQIGHQTGIWMHNSDIVEKVQRGLPPGETIDAEVIERMLKDYWAVDPDSFGPPDDLDP